MNESRKQSIRLMKFIIEMKRRRYPNSQSFAALLRQADLYENIDIACSPRTIQRDIDLLKNTYEAPLAFDSFHKGYYLTDPAWTPELELPMEQKEFVIHSLLGAKTLKEIAPQPLKSKMSETIERAQATNQTTFLDEEFVKYLIVASGMKVVISPAIFKTILDAWRTRRVIQIHYSDPKGIVNQRTIEPHVVAFHHGLWYIKGYKLPAHESRILAIHRISQAELTEETFSYDQKLLADIERNGLFTYPKVTGVRLLCDASIAFYLKEHQPVKKFKIEPQPNGDLLVTLAPAIEHDVLRWILGEAGRIEVLQPQSLREKVAAAGKRIFEKNSRK